MTERFILSRAIRAIDRAVPDLLVILATLAPWGLLWLALWHFLGWQAVALSLGAIGAMYMALYLGGRFSVVALAFYGGVAGFGALWLDSWLGAGVVVLTILFRTVYASIRRKVT